MMHGQKNIKSDKRVFSNEVNMLSVNQ